MTDHPKDPEHFVVKRRRTSQGHQKNNTKGYAPSAGKLPGGKPRPDKDYCQIHHILPVSSVQDASIKKQIPNESEFEIVRNCLGCTNWNIDNVDNVIGLPLKRAFVTKKAPKSGLWNLPCHIYGHPQYTAKVKTKLKHQVWNKALKKAAECDVEYTAIKQELEFASQIWHTFLTARGAMNGGTQICWKERRYRKQWWLPFSMDPGKPKEVRPPPTMEDFQADMKDALSRLFKK